MMRNLVSAADVKKWVENKEKTVYLDTNTIITPAARDAARDNGIEIVEGSAACARPAASDPGTGVVQPDGQRPKVIDQAIIAQIVEEVITILGQRKTAAYEADPCGFKLVRGEQLNWGDGPGKVKVKQVFDSQDSPNILAGLISQDGITPVREVKGSEVHYVLEGAVSYRLNGREYVGRAGDSVLLPAGAQVSLTGKAKIFFTAYPTNW